MTPIIVRTERELDALGAEHILGLKVLVVPALTTWAGVGMVVEAMVAQDYIWRAELANMEGDHTSVFLNGRDGDGWGPTLPISTLLAALAAKGIEVRYEPKEGKG